MKTISEILDVSINFLMSREVAQPRRLIEELLSHVLNLPRLELYVQFDRPLQPKELDLLREHLKAAAKGMPWQYIVGQVSFLGCTIKVTPDVLIPRQETEILADRIVKELPQEPCTVWDICCGSGCLGIAVKKKRPDCRVVLSDLSEKAVGIAKENAETSGVELEVRQGDLLQPFQGMKADVVICNPPYVSESDYQRLETEVKDWEPKMALVGGPSGFEFYERLAKELSPYLNPGAKLYLEMGTGMGNRIREIFSQWSHVEVLQDWALHDRFCVAVR